MNYYSQYNFNQNNDQPESQFFEAPAEAVFAERKRIRRAGNAIGGGLLIFSALPILISLGLEILVPLLGFNIEDFRAAVSGDPGLWIYQTVMSLVIFTLPFILAAMFYGQKASSAIMFAAPKKGLTFPLALMGIGACGVANLMASLFDSIFSYGGNTTEDIIGAFPKDPLGVLLVVLTVCAVPALVEEFAFRGVVLGLLRNVSEPFAIFMSALLFGLMHGNFSQIPFAFILGMVLGFGAVSTGSVWPACLIHFLCNGISVGMTYAQTALSEESAMILNLMIYIAMLGLGFVGIIQFVKKQGEKFLKSKPQPTLPGKDKFKVFITSPCIIIFVIIAIIEAIALEFSL